MACRKTGGEAQAIVSRFHNIVVPWDAAVAAYERSTIPRFGRLVLSTFPHAVELKGHAFGALFSLVFNRGSSLSGPKRVEMQNIFAHMQARRFDKVPAELRAMVRHWPNLRGLQVRREAEARLFERGLQQMAAPVVVSAPPPASSPPAAGQKLESAAGSAIARTIDGDAAFFDVLPGQAGDNVHLESPHSWDDVSWPDSDSLSPDYRHLPADAKGTTFQFTAADLECLIELNSFEPDRTNGKIIFALRGAELVGVPGARDAQASQVGSQALLLRERRPNHYNFRCVIGVCDLATRHMSAFQASTVPNRRAVASYLASRQSGNMMPTGLYRFEVGWHHANSPKRVPGCLIENGRQKAVLRADRHPFYDATAVWEDNRLHGDNLHPAFADPSAEFSSYGCLVINGTYHAGGDRAAGEHAGEWGRFREALGLQPRGTRDHGKIFDVVLLTGMEAALAHDLTARPDGKDKEAARQALRRFRQGSRGEGVKRIQQGLGLPVTGVLDHRTAKTLADFQRQRSADKTADGIYSPALEAELKIAQAFAAPQVPLLSETLESAPGSLRLAPEDAERQAALEYELGLYAEAFALNAAPGGTRLESVPRPEARLESLDVQRLLNIQGLFGSLGLREKGIAFAERLRDRLRDYICNPQTIDGALGHLDISAKVTDAATKGAWALKSLFVDILSRTPPTSFMPNAALVKGVDLIWEQFLVPAAGRSGDVVTEKINVGAGWLCRRWGAGDGVADGAEPHTPAPPSQTAPSHPAPPTTPTAATTSLYDHLMATCSLSSADELRDKLWEIGHTGAPISPSDTKLLKLLCDKRVITPTEKRKATAAEIVRDIAEIIALTNPQKGKPFDRVTVGRKAARLIDTLAGTDADVPAENAYKLLKALRGWRCFDDMTRLGEAFITRQSALKPALATQYAQALIDSGQIVAGMALLREMLAAGSLDDGERKEAHGLLGRGHKQIYVDHVATPADALRFKTDMDEALANYGKIADLMEPHTNHWQAINYIAIAERAQNDQIAVAGGTDAQTIARRLVDRLAPDGASDDPWVNATLGEAHLALNDLDKAAQYFAKFANDPEITAFHLNSTIRQLRQLWKIEPAATGRGAILTGLMTALAHKDHGAHELTAGERRMIAHTDKIEFSQHFETTTKDGKFVMFATLRNIVRCGESIAAFQRIEGEVAETLGTGFLVKGSDFGLTDDPRKSYVLTNAHVLWDQERGDGYHQSALTPDEVRIVFENELLDGRIIRYRCKKVLWQSPSDMLDACLLQLDKRVEKARPLELAPVNFPLNASEDDPQQGTKLIVIGHTSGRKLAVGVGGSIEDMRGTLVDRGPKAGTEKPTYLHYVAPTEGGNSGSPVIEAQEWRVVGLHHAGFGDSEGLQRLGGKDGTHKANEGIHIDSIREAARKSLKPS